MSAQQSAYHSFATLLTSLQQPVTPAELQGFLLGRSCANANFDQQQWLLDAAELFAGELPETLHSALQGLQLMTYQELTNTETMALTLLLPEDELSLSERLQALSEWCQSFLAGFGLSIGSIVVTEQAAEVLEDFVALANIADAEEGEENEQDYMEVSEYLRVAPLLLFAECGAKQTIVAPQDHAPVTH